MVSKFGRRPFRALLVPLLAVALWSSTGGGVEAAKPGPATSCAFSDHVTCVVTLDVRGRAPDVASLTLVECGTNRYLGHLVTTPVAKGDVISFNSTSATSPAWLMVWVWAGSRAISYSEDRSLCDIAP